MNLSRLPFYPAAILVMVAHSLCAGEPAPAPETSFKLSAWSYGRERKTVTSSNRVTAGIKIQNISKSSVADVSATLVYSTGLGEKIAGPVTQKLGTLKPGESKPVNFVCDFVPAFQSYSIVLQFDGKKKEEWFGNSDTAQPEPRLSNLKGEARVVLVGKETAVDKSGLLSGTLHVKNEGTEAAKNVRFTIVFVDLNRKKLKEETLPLGSGVVEGGADENIPVKVPGCPRNYGGYSIDLVHDDAPPEATLAGGDFSGAADVEFAHFKVTHPAAKGDPYRFAAQCRNGLKNSVDHVSLQLVFFAARHREIKRFTYEVPGTIRPAEILDVHFDIQDLPPFEEYEQKIGFSERTRPNTPAAEESFKFAGKQELELAFKTPHENSDGSVSIEGAARNGLTAPVADVVVHLSFVDRAGKEITAVDTPLKQPLNPGGSREFDLTVPKAAGFANYTFSFKFHEIPVEAKR